jgi:hypothetical protein
MVDEGITPDFIVVDGSEGGTGAAPLEFEDYVGMPLTDGLITLHNALVGTGLRDRIRIGASGKIATGMDVVKRIAQGADYTNAARAMMMAVGCIQAQKCQTNHCPTGVATQDPRRYRALDVTDKSERVRRFQQATVAEAQQITASMGLEGPGELCPGMVLRRINHHAVHSFSVHHGLNLVMSRGKSVASRTFSAPISLATQRSRPNANPPCGGIPCWKACRYPAYSSVPSPRAASATA